MAGLNKVRGLSRVKGSLRRTEGRLKARAAICLALAELVALQPLAAYAVNTCDDFSGGKPHPYASITPGGSKMGDCNIACTSYDEFMKNQNNLVSASCGTGASPGPSPTAGSSGSYTAMQSKFTDQAACVKASMGEWAILGQYCKAYRLYDEAWKWNAAAASTYTAAGALCLVAFGLYVACNGPAAIGGACGYYGAAQAACTVAGVLATGAEIAGMAKLSVDGSKDVDQWSNGFANLIGMNTGGAAGGLAASLGSGIATGMSRSVAKQATKVTTELNMDVVKAVGPLLAASGALFLATAGIQFAALGTNQQGAECGCQTVSKLQSFGRYIQASQVGPSGSGSAGAIGATGASGGGTLGAGSEYNPVNEVKQGLMAAGFPPPFASAATAGPAGELLSNMPNAGDIPNVLSQLGIDPNAITQKIMDGQSPAQAAASSMPGALGEAMTPLFQKMDELINDGKIEVGAYTGGGGGGGAKASTGTDPLSMLAAFAPKTPAGTLGKSFKEITFGKKPSRSLAGEDIWHSSWKGSIFDIISEKLTVTRNRITEGEWTTPMNRALNGLSNVPPPAASAQKSGMKKK